MKLIALISSVFSITSTGINAILFRVLLFLLRAAYMCTLGASYMGLTYIIVYAGGIAILFLFVIMRLSPGISAKEDRIGAAVPLGLVLITLIWLGNTNYMANDPNTTEVSALVMPFAPNMIDNIALYLYAPNAIWLRVLGVRFLVSRVGCIVLCLRDK